MRGVSCPAEQLLQLHRQHRLLARVVHPDPRPARHLDPLRRHLVQPGRALHGSSRAAPRPVDALQVGPPRRGQLRPRASDVEQRGVGHVRPRRRPTPGGRTPAAAVPPAPRGPAQQADPLPAQPVAARPPAHGRAPAAARRTARSRRAARPGGPPRRRRPARPPSLHLTAPRPPPGGRLVDHHGLADPRRRRAGGPVGDRHGQPLRGRRAATPRRARAAVPDAIRYPPPAPPRHPLGEGQRDHQPGQRRRRSGPRPSRRPRDRPPLSRLASSRQRAATRRRRGGPAPPATRSSPARGAAARTAAPPPRRRARRRPAPSSSARASRGCDADAGHPAPARGGPAASSTAPSACSVSRAAPWRRAAAGRAGPGRWRPGRPSRPPAARTPSGRPARSPGWACSGSRSCSACGPAAVDGAGRLTPRPPGALAGGGPRHPYGGQRAEAAGVVGARLAGQPGVHHHPHARDRQARLGHRRGQHHPPPARPATAPRPARRPGPAVHLQHAGRSAEQPRRPWRSRPTPGRKHSTSPSRSASARRTTSATCEQRGVDAQAVRRATGRGGGAHTISTGCVAPAARTIGAPGVAAEQPGPGRGVGGGGGGDEPQVGPQGVADVQEERQRRVGVQVAFVALVEHDHVHARQLRVALEALQEHAGGDDLDHRARAAHADGARRVPMV